MTSMFSEELRRVLFPSSSDQDSDSDDSDGDDEAPPSDLRPDDSNETPAGNTAASEMNTEAFVLQNQHIDAPAMSREERVLFEEHVVPAFLEAARSGSESDGDEARSTSIRDHQRCRSSASSSDGGSARISDAERNELKDMEAHLNMWQDAYLNRRAPDKYADIARLPCFRAFDEQWIFLLIGDAQVLDVFLYFHTLRLAGIGALQDDVDSTLYACEMYGTTVSIDERCSDYIRARVLFAPRSFDGKKHESDSAKSKARSAVQRMRQLGTTQATKHYSETLEDGRRYENPFEEKSEIDLMKEASAQMDDRQESKAQYFRKTRAEALSARPPRQFAWTQKMKMTPQELERMFVDRYNEISRDLADTTVDDMLPTSSSDDDSNDSAVSSSGSESDESSSDDEYDAFAGMVMPHDISKTDMLKRVSSSVSASLARHAQKCRQRVHDDRPDSTARSDSEISGWVEDHLTIDVFVYPGVSDEPIPRALEFCFSVCDQNPHSFMEVVRSTLNAGGPFAKDNRPADSDDDGV